jgi:hypothetical protein
MRRLETVERLDAEDLHVRSGNVVLSVNYVGLPMTPPTLFPWCLRGSGGISTSCTSLMRLTLKHMLQKLGTMRIFVFVFGTFWRCIYLLHHLDVLLFGLQGKFVVLVRTPL